MYEGNMCLFTFVRVRVQYNVVPSLFEGTFVKVNLLSYESKYLLIHKSWQLTVHVLYV